RPVDSSGEDIRVVLKKVSIILRKLGWFARIDLKHTVWPSFASNQDVDHAFHAVVNQELWDFKTSLLCDVSGNDGRAAPKGETRRRLLVCSQSGVPDNAWRPADTGFQEHGLPIILQFQHLG